MIVQLRGQKVMLDFHLAALYDVPTKALVQAVKRNAERFPADFMFRLSAAEFAGLRSQIVTSNGRGGRRSAPVAFTEQGVAMLSSVLKSPRAARVNVEIMRAFVHLRRLLASHADLARQIRRLRNRYDRKFQQVFDVIERLLREPESPRRRIGFVPRRAGSPRA